MTMPGAFNGKFLRVDLTRGTTQVEEVPELTYRMFLGGGAMAAHLLTREIKPGSDPLGPDNVLVFTTCPTNGSPISGTSRFSAAAKSPLSDAHGEAEAGGWWGPELKLAGFDAVIVMGQSPRPVYLWITDGQAELRDAGHLWGKLSGQVEAKDPAALSRLVQWFRETYDRNADMVHKFGTARGVKMLDTDGILPSYNFQRGQFEQAKELTGQAMAETILVDTGTCFACAVSCKREVEVPEFGVSPRYGGPEYETIAAGGSLCGIGDLKALARFNQLCAEYVMDSISAGAITAFAMECFERGILTSKDTDGIELRFGNAEALVTMTEKIGKREGFGDILAEGAQRAAQRIGRGAEEFALTVKGQEIPMHEPRGKKSLTLAYSTAPGGADHVRAPHDHLYESFHPSGAHPLEALGLCEPVPRLELSPRKVRAYYYTSNWWSLCSTVGICTIAAAPINILGLTQVVDLTHALTGWDTSLWELFKVAERGKALARVFNCREGLTPADDRLPKRLHEAFSEGPLKGVNVDPETFARALRLYYQMEGWDPKTGWPTFARLAELGIEWAARPGDTW
jgi:aldehyde:ferredoxin oxidoreductase